MGANWPEADVAAMRAALECAREADAHDEVPVGAVVMAGKEIIGRGFNRSITDHDPTAHAEIVALREASRAVGNYRLANATLYVTLEPCAMCVGALAQARVSRLVFGAYDAKSGAAGSVVDLTDSRAINHRFEVNGGLLADECGELLSEFFAKKR